MVTIAAFDHAKAVANSQAIARGHESKGPHTPSPAERHAEAVVVVKSLRKAADRLNRKDSLTALDPEVLVADLDHAAQFVVDLFQLPPHAVNA
jgi:hypothetical protein